MKLKTAVWSLVQRSDVHRRYMWWTVIQFGERCYGLYGEVLAIGYVTPQNQFQTTYFNF